MINLPFTFVQITDDNEVVSRFSPSEYPNGIRSITVKNQFNEAFVISAEGVGTLNVKKLFPSQTGILRVSPVTQNEVIID